MIKKRIPNTIVVATTGLVTAAILLFFRLGIIDAATMTMAATVSGTAFLAGIVTLVYEYDFGYSKLLKRTLKKLVDEARDGVKVLRQDQKLDITLVKAEDGQHIRVNSMHHYWLKS